MKKKAKLYLDTSAISTLFDERNPERRSLTESFFRAIQDFDVYVSEITIAEIEKTPDSKLQSDMRGIVSVFTILPLDDDVEWLAREYIRYGAVPEGYLEDAYHIASAVINSMDCVLSWNFRHIVRRRTRDIVRMVNSINGLRHIEIMTPAEIL